METFIKIEKKKIKIFFIKMSHKYGLIFKRLLKSTDFIICIKYFRKVWQNLANLPDLLNNANNI